MRQRQEVVMPNLKKLAPESIGPALAKVERYRLLNEPWEAESICRDVLEVEPDNQQAVVWLLLSLTDQFRNDLSRVSEAEALIDRIDGEYGRLYYRGIIAERTGKAHLYRGAPGAAPIAYDCLRTAMDWYEKAEPLRPAGNDDAILRWNTCVRLLERFPNLEPHDEPWTPMLLE
jgi:hypothetical protein